MRAGPIWAVMRAVWIELLRRRDLSVVAFLMAVYLLGVFAVRTAGIENPETGTLLLNLGLTLAAGAAHVLAVLMATRQVAEELEHRTLLTLLARPVDRTAVLAAKWLAVAVAGAACLAVLGGVAWLSVPRLESYHPGMLAQAVVAGALSVALAAALAMALSLVVPKAVASLVTLGLVFGAGTLLPLLRIWADRRAAGPLWAWLLGYLPDFGKLDLVVRYTDGIAPLPAAEAGALFLYGGLFTAALLVLAAWRFRRMPL